MRPLSKFCLKIPGKYLKRPSSTLMYAGLSRSYEKNPPGISGHTRGGNTKNPEINQYTDLKAGCYILISKGSTMVEEPKGIFSPLELMKATGISVLKLISYLPFPVLYGLSGLFAFILQHVVRYRKDVIVNNLRHAFPDYTDKQIASTVNKFYRHFGDITVETIKAYSL